MVKQIHKGYKGYFYKDSEAEEVIGIMGLASLASSILTVIAPPVGIVLDVIIIPTTIGTGIGMGTNLAINRNHSRKLFEAISNGDVDGIEKRLNRISKKFDGNKKYIFNGVMDKNGNTLITSIIKSKKITEEKKKELIGRMIDNGANIASILEKNNNGKTLIEEVAEKKEAEPGLLEFLAGKTKDKLDSREAKYNPILEKYNKKLNKYEEKINSIEAEIEKREEEVKSGFHPFKKMAIRNLKENLEELKKERKKIVKAKNKIDSKIEEKVANKREIIARYLNKDKNERSNDGPMQIG